MKKLIHLSIALVAMCLLNLSAFAQVGFDYFAVPRSVVVVSPQLISGGAAGNLTNGWIDIHSFLGPVQVLLVAQTNTTGTATVTIENSSTTTNGIVNLGSIAIASSTSVNFTNAGNAPTVTNTYLFPGTATTATAASAGYAGTYLFPAPYTNSGAITFGSGPLLLGFDSQDALRYIRFIISPGGTATNLTVGGVLSGLRRTNPLIP